MIKRLLAIISLLCLYLLSNENISFNKEAGPVSADAQSTIHISYKTYPVAAISNYTFTCNTNTDILASVRSNIQNPNTCNERFLKTAIRLFELFLLKESNTLQHISESVIAYDYLNYHSLRHRTGYLVYALRKLLI